MSYNNNHKNIKQMILRCPTYCSYRINPRLHVVLIYEFIDWFPINNSLRIANLKAQGIVVPYDSNRDHLLHALVKIETKKRDKLP